MLQQARLECKTRNIESSRPCIKAMRVLARHLDAHGQREQAVEALEEARAAARGSLPQRVFARVLMVIDLPRAL